MSETSYITAGDGCRIAYRLEGAADLPVLVLSNSIATTLHMWDGEMGWFTKRFRVLRYDLRGHGRSDAPAGAYSLDRLGRDVLELLDALGLERVRFCGLSLGGFIGQWLGIHAPERIERLVLSNASPHLGPATYFDARIGRTLAAPDLAEQAEMFLGDWFPPALFQTHPQLISNFREMILSISPQGLAGCFAAVRDADLRRTIALIDRPTLVIGGRYDTVTAASHSEAMARTIPGAELRLLDGVHLLNVERREEFLAAVQGFLGADVAPARRDVDCEVGVA
ncbi:MAG: alpha/beta fold hydrolase [Caulobacterales bacterium]|nr:alpha/beta fold hydrolase [Caulobacterales bacterium]